MASSPPPTLPLSPPNPTSTSTADNTVPSHATDSSPMATAQEIEDQGRRPSIQFAANNAPQSIRTESPSTSQARLSRRISSPPPPSTFQPRVSFDTSDNPDAADFSLTLNAKHKDYQYTRRSRTFLVGTDQNDYSEFALEWLIDELVDDGDEIVCLRVIEKDSKIISDASLEEGIYRTEAKKLLDQIIEKNSEEKAISLVLEFAVGRVQDTIQHMIHIYEPAMLIVGTRGRSLGGIQGLLPGSVSKYCLQHSPVPVIVVRPTSKREKKKKKRQADPARRSYLEILEKSNPTGGHMLDRNNINIPVENGAEATENEAAAVAAAVGLDPDKVMLDYPFNMAPMSRVRSDDSQDPAATLAGEDSDAGVVMKSPELQNLDSPPASESEEEDEDGGAPLHDISQQPLANVAEEPGNERSEESSVHNNANQRSNPESSGEQKND